MMNNVMLVGRLVDTPNLFVAESGNKGAFITLAIGRPYKNIDGEYETDFIDCTLWTAIAENTVEYCKKGDTIGVRGKLQSRIIENEDGTKYKKMEVIAERVSFISSKPIGDNNVEKNEEVVLTEEVDKDVSVEKEKPHGEKHNKKKE